MKESCFLTILSLCLFIFGCGRSSPEPNAIPLYSSGPSVGSLFHVILSPSGRIIAYGRAGDEIVCFDTATRQERILLNIQPSSVRSLAISRDERLLAIACGHEKNVVVTDMRSGQQLLSIDLEVEPLALCFSQRSDELFVAAGPSIMSWNMITTKRGAFISKYPLTLRFLISSPTENTIAVTAREKPAHLDIKTRADVICWNVDTNDVINTMRVKTAETVKCSYSPDGKLIAVQTDDSVILTTASLAEAGKELRNVHRIVATAFSPDSSSVFVVDESGRCLKWELGSGQQKVCASVGAKIMDASFSEDSEYLVTKPAPGTSFMLWKRESVFGR